MGARPYPSSGQTRGAGMMPSLGLPRLTIDHLIRWATGTQMVRFSTGANEHINRGLESEEYRAVEPCVGTEQKSEFNPESDDPS
jgi:hypothetical protein